MNSASPVVLEDTSPVTKTSRTVKLGFKNEDGTPMKIKNIKQPIQLKIPQDINAPKVNLSELAPENPSIVDRYEETLFYHRTWIEKEHSALKIIFR